MPWRALLMSFVALSMLLPAGRADATLFRFPVENTDGQAIWTAMIFGVDHDPEPGTDRTDCINYDGVGFPLCYDDHDGSDFLLNGGFDAMDAGSAWVVAGADGVVTRVVDGNYDRCHGDMNSMFIDCDGHEMRANVVEIEHDDGWVSLYVHFMKESIIVEVGDEVACGDRLGLIGSSGISSMPHLHFEIENPAGEVVDPYAGPMSQDESYWVEQDGPNRLPAERCEGDPVPPEPVVEPVVEATVEVPPELGGEDVAVGEDIPVTPEVMAPETWSTDTGDGPSVGQDTTGTVVEENSLWPFSSEGCAAGASHAGATTPWALFALLGALAILRRRTV